jgi:prevent-host-death family protein
VRNVNLADAKAHLSKLVERAAAGDIVRIICRGKPVAQITAVQTPRKRIDLSSAPRDDRHDAGAAGIRPRPHS